MTQPGAHGRLLPATALWIARRYLFSRRHGYAAFVNWVSFVGLTLGVAILTAVTSVMNGFGQELIDRTLAAAPHVVVASTGEGTQVAAALAEVPGVIAVGRHYRGEGLVSHAAGNMAVTVMGVDRAGADALADIGDGAGGSPLAALFRHERGILLGPYAATAFGIEPGDPVVVTMAAAGSGGIQPRLERFTLAGTFEVGAAPDSTLAMVRYDDIAARGLARHGVAGWRAFLADPLDLAPALADIRARLGDRVEVTTWGDRYGGLFRAVQIERAMMFVLLSLIVAIAAFNVVSCQAMLVNEKRADAAILATMGATRGFLGAIFFLQGAAVAAAGVATGLLLGVTIAVNADAVLAAVEFLVGASIIEGTYFRSVPSEVRGTDLAVISLLSLGLCALALLRPAMRITAENPADALHSL